MSADVLRAANKVLDDYVASFQRRAQVAPNASAFGSGLVDTGSVDASGGGSADKIAAGEKTALND